MDRDKAEVLSRTKGRRGAASVLTLLMLVASQVESAHAAPGQELFETNCAVCHGIEGTPILPNAPHFAKGDRLEKSDDQLHKSIAEGLNVMPPWNSVLSEQAIDLVVVYIRTLAR
jgi:cytochrome c6